MLGYLAAYSPKGELSKRPSDDDVAQSIDGCPEVTNEPDPSPAPLWALSLTTVALTLPLCATQVVRSDREKEADERNGGALTSSIHGAVDDDPHPEAARSRRHLIKAEAEQARSPSRAPPPLFLALSLTALSPSPARPSLWAPQFYMIVMPLAQRNLWTSLKQERWAGSDLKEIRHVFEQLV